MTLFRGLDNFVYYLPEDYYTFKLSISNNLTLCMNIPTSFFVILFVSFIFQNEFYHCNLEILRGLFPISALILYPILYGCLFGYFLICLDFIRDIFLHENLPIFLYSIHSLLCTIASNIIGVILNFVFIISIFNILSLVYLSMFLHKRFTYFYNGL